MATRKRTAAKAAPKGPFVLVDSDGDARGTYTDYEDAVSRAREIIEDESISYADIARVVPFERYERSPIKVTQLDANGEPQS